MWEADASKALLVGAPSWRASAGPAPAEWLGRGWLDAIHPEDRAHAERLWHEAVAARSPISAELRLRAPGGGWRWTDIRAAPVLDAEGRIERWAGMDVDIDARKRAEAALNRGEAELLHLPGGGRGREAPRERGAPGRHLCRRAGRPVRGRPRRALPPRERGTLPHSRPLR
ncbi:PAS domain-containing protein [Roseomonas sp. GCM10028921]